MRHEALFVSALRRVRPAVLLWLFLGNALALGAAALWLLIPDSHVWQLTVSFVFGAIIIAGVLASNALGLRAVRGVYAIRLWKAALVLAAFMLLAFLTLRLFALAVPGIELRAGLWNSQMSAGLRHAFTYQRLIVLQNAVLNGLRWVLLPGLIAPFALESVSSGLHGGAIRRSLGVLVSWKHWATVVAGPAVAAWLVPALLGWHPAHTVSGEVLSAALRLGLACVLGAVACLLLLAVDSELLARQEVLSARTSDLHEDAM